MDEIKDIIFFFMPAIWKNKMLEQRFIYTDSIIKEMTDFLETMVVNLETREHKKKSSASSKKKKEKRSLKKWK